MRATRIVALACFGDKTRVTIHPMKGDRLGGQLLTATLPGGGKFQTRDPAALGTDPEAPPTTGVPQG